MADSLMSEDYICKRLSAETICQDLQVLILKRLPVKTLLRCRCVCKWWKEIIASKCFVLDHLASQRPRLIAQNRSTNYLLLDTRTLPSCDSLSCPDQFLFLLFHSFVVVGGIHGVMCLYNNADRLFLWNPSTRQSFGIPLRGLWVCREYIGRKYCGFWIDPSNNDFKIVIFKPLPRIRATLFSSGAWTEVDVGGTVPGCVGTFGSLQVLIGGVGHWLAYTNTRDDEKIILFFDFRKDKFGAIEAPDRAQLSKSPHNVKLCKWQDFLSLMHWKTYRPYRCDMWAMQNDGSWSKMFSFNLIKGIREVHCVLEDWGRLVVSDYDIHSKELLYYDSKDRCTTPLESKFVRSGAPFVVCEFVESLIFPDPKCISSD